LRTKLQSLINHRYFVPACLVSAVVVRLCWVLAVNFEQVSDYGWYYNFALNIAAGRGYSFHDVRVAYWPVGYPGFLGGLFYLFGPHQFVGKIANIFLYLGVIALTYRFSKMIFHSETAARISLLILTFYPNHIAYSSLLSTEILFVFLLLLGAVLFVLGQHRWIFWMVSGFAWGLATLTKTQALLVPLIFIPVFLTNKKSMLKACGAVYVAMFFVLLPWLYRNDLLFGKPLLSTNGGIVLMIGNNPYATGRQIWDMRVRSLLGDLGNKNENESMSDGREVAREKKAQSVALSYIAHHPLADVALWPKKFTALYLSDVDGIYYSWGMRPSPSRRSTIIYVGLRIFAELYYIFILTLFVASLPVMIRSKITEHRIGIYLVLYFTLTYLIYFGNARYHFALMPFVVIYSGIEAALILKGRDAAMMGPTV
jgi:4-amino-4-deoxy-L-arabinose transferase-like glycosyltransferase